MTSTYYQMVRLAASISVLINKNKPGTEVAPSAEWDEVVYCVVFCAFSMSFLLITHAGCIYLFSLFLLEVAYAVDDGERCTGIIHPKS